MHGRFKLKYAFHNRRSPVLIQLKGMPRQVDTSVIMKFDLFYALCM